MLHFHIVYQLSLIITKFFPRKTVLQLGYVRHFQSKCEDHVPARQRVHLGEEQQLVRVARVQARGEISRCKGM